METVTSIRQLKPNEQIPYDLLLLADETIDAIDKYIHNSEIYLYEHKSKIIGVYALEILGNDYAEIKNIAVDTDFQGQGIGTKLLENATEIAIKKGIIFLSIGTADLAFRQIQLYEKVGFVKSKIIKDYFIKNYCKPIYENRQQLKDMVILKKLLPNKNITTKKLTNQDIDKFIELIKVFENVFEMKDFAIPSNSHLQGLLDNNSFIAFVAILNNKVVGGLTAYTLQQCYSIFPLVYVYDLAISNEYQRQGIGRHLIKNLNKYCKENNIEEVFIQADLEDDYAIDFYRLTGGQESNVVNFSYKLNDPKQ